MSVILDTSNAVTSVLDSRLLQPGTCIRMCTGCADALDHSQHEISEQGPESLLALLESCGHPPMIFDAQAGTCTPAGQSAVGSTAAAGVKQAAEPKGAPQSREEALALLSAERTRVSDAVERCSNLCNLCNLQVERVSHIPVVASEGQTSNEHHHVVLKDQPEGHIVVSLFLAGKKKKSKCLVVKKPSTRPDLKSLGAKLASAGLPDKEFRLADQELMMDVLGVGKDFASPLALVEDAKGMVDIVVFDTELEDGKPLWCLP